MSRKQQPQLYGTGTAGKVVKFIGTNTIGDGAALNINLAESALITYTGNSAVNRAIAHGLSKAKIAIIFNQSVNPHIYIIGAKSGNVIRISSAGVISYEGGVTDPDGTNIYVGSTTSKWGNEDSTSMVALVIG